MTVLPGKTDSFSAKRDFLKMPDGLIDSIVRLLPLIKRKEEFVESPIRGEYFSIADLRRLARTTAAKEHTDVYVSINTEGKRLSNALKKNKKIISKTYEILRGDLKERPFLPAEAWIFDNYNHILQTISQMGAGFTTPFYTRLPILRLSRKTRIYELCYLLIACSDSSLTVERITNFIQEYQRVTHLETAELWMLPLILQALLVENIARLSRKVLKDRADRRRVHRWINHFANFFLTTEIGYLGQALKVIFRRESPTSTYFLLELVTHLMHKGFPSKALNLQIAQLSGANEEAIQDAIQKERLTQRENERTIKSAIISLQNLAKADWAEFVEALSRIEKILHEDPAGAYLLMDFATRDYYRHAVEQIAFGANCKEEEVARRAVEICRKEKSRNSPFHRTHVGYYLIDNGRSQLENLFACRPALAEKFDRFVSHNASATYYSLLALLFTLSFNFFLYLLIRGPDVPETPLYILGIVILLVSPSINFASTLTNFVLLKVIHPAYLPRMDPERGVAGEDRTLVTSPTLLISGKGEPGALLRDLEMWYLANQDPNIFFALALAFPETAAVDPTPTKEEEGALSSVTEGIETLNAKYGRKFFLFFRDRSWNEREGRWIEWERKRGKIEKLNELLRGSSETDLKCLAGDVSLLTSFKYVVTVDRDLRLPRDSVKLLIATISHPLNRAVVDKENKRVVRGYGIIQPRLAFSLQEKENTLFSSALAAPAGWDSYSGVVSDIYQDLFNESVYFGKGIYDIDVFNTVLNQRFPENLLLSHDFLEGFYVRTGFASDVQVFEGFPTSYVPYVSRLHRWIRGDWQVLQWLFPKVPGSDGKSVNNPLRFYQRWRIFENLVRSFCLPSIFFLLIFTWLSAPPKSFLVDYVALLLVSFSAILAFVDSLPTRPDYKLWYFHFFSAYRQFTWVVKNSLIYLTFLGSEAFVSLDAIGSSLFRMLVTKRKLLEWTTAHQVELSVKGSGPMSWRAGLIGVSVFIPVLFFSPASLKGALFFIVIWSLAPLVASWVSRRSQTGKILLSLREQRELRQMGKMTWRFFQELVSHENHFLPPDDFQETAKPPISPRTSITDIGFYLLSMLSAYDLGFIGPLGVLGRLRETSKTLRKMRRYKGHFFNWYDIRTLEPTSSRYISTVDSGNLAISLIILKQGLLELPAQPIITAQRIQSFQDTSFHIRSQLKSAWAVATLNSIDGYLSKLRAILAGDAGEPSVSQIYHTVTQLLEKVEALCKGGLSGADLTFHLEDFLSSVRGEVVTLEFFHSWLKKPVMPPGILRSFDNLLTPRLILQRCRELSKALATKSSEGKKTHTHSRLIDSYQEVQEFISDCEQLSQELERLALEMDFSFLYDHKRNLFPIGFSLGRNRFDKTHYDLLASESRLASYFAIAKGDVPLKHWVSLGRPLTSFWGMPVPISWGGSMFEYLLPLTFMRSVPNTLLWWCYRAVVAGQKHYGRKEGVPWGVSESSYAKRNQDSRYRYDLFGVPYFGFKKGLAKSLVVAPYSSFLALEIDAKAAFQNLSKLRAEGAQGGYGFFESLDYTPYGGEAGSKVAVATFLSHHQGMSLVSVADVLCGHKMQDRFMSDNRLGSLSFLLEERLPSDARTVPSSLLTGLITERGVVSEPLEVEEKQEYTFPHKSHAPILNLLSNGDYRVYVSNRGSGFIEYKGVDVTRRSEDPANDNIGSFFYILDANSGKTWGATYQPLLARPLKYETLVSENHVRVGQIHHEVESQLEIMILPEGNGEVRRLCLRNLSSDIRALVVISYSEIVLSQYSNYRAHPAYERLFVESELIANDMALCFSRRNVGEENKLFLVCKSIAEGPNVTGFKFETSRFRFLGRGRTPSNPLAITPGVSLTSSTNADLDTIASFRWEVRLLPGEQTNFYYLNCVSSSKEEALALTSKFSSESSILQAIETMHKQVDRQGSVQEIESAQLLLSCLVYGSSSLIWGKYDRRELSRLVSLSVSMELPLLVVKINPNKPKWDVFLHQVLGSCVYLFRKGFGFEILILFQSSPDVYFESEFKVTQQTLSDYGLDALPPEKGKVVIHKTESLQRKDMKLLEAYAHVVLDSSKGMTMISQLRESFGGT